EDGVTYQGQILAGRARNKSCESLGVEMRWTEYTGSDPVGYVLATNLRRDLSQSQRAAVAAELCHRPRGRTANPQICGFTVEKAAKALGVSERLVEYAIDIRKKRPDLHERVRRGELTINAAQKEMEPEPQSEPEADGAHKLVCHTLRDIAK